MAAIYTQATIEELFQAVFSVWSARRLYQSTDRVEKKVQFNSDRGPVYILYIFINMFNV
jgi:hypothetical protein